ncbi:MAG: ribosome maturation factor RimP [Alphaproteobacteria bacterium]
MDRARDIEPLMTLTIEAMGYSLVRVKMMAKPGRTLQVMVERQDGEPVSLDQCAEISRALSAVLDVNDPIPGRYHLEVSSAGIARPLVRPGDFERFAGFEARVETRCPIAGRRRFRGRLAGVSAGAVHLTLGEGDVALPFEDIAGAQLVLTDELLAGTRNRQRN